MFDSGKQLLLSAVQSEYASPVPSYEGAITLRFAWLQLPSVRPAEMKQLLEWDNASLVFNVALDPRNENAEADATFQNQRGRYSGSIWATSDDIVAGLTQFQPVLSQLSNTFGSSNVPTMPQYLDTCGLNAAQVHGFWNHLNRDVHKQTPGQIEATR